MSTTTKNRVHNSLIPQKPIEVIFSSKGKLKILNLLSMEEELNITAIVNRTNLNHSRIKIHLKELIENSIIIEKRFGRIKIFKINEKYPSALKIKNFLKEWNKEM